MIVEHSNVECGAQPVAQIVERVQADYGEEMDNESEKRIPTAGLPFHSTVTIFYIVCMHVDLCLYCYYFIGVQYHMHKVSCTQCMVEVLCHVMSHDHLFSISVVSCLVCVWTIHGHESKLCSTLWFVWPSMSLGIVPIVLACHMHVQAAYM